MQKLKIKQKWRNIVGAVCAFVMLATIPAFSAYASPEEGAVTKTANSMEQLREEITSAEEGKTTEIALAGGTYLFDEEQGTIEIPAATEGAERKIVLKNADDEPVVFKLGKMQTMFKLNDNTSLELQGKAGQKDSITFDGSRETVANNLHKHGVFVDGTESNVHLKATNVTFKNLWTTASRYNGGICFITEKPSTLEIKDCVATGFFSTETYVYEDYIHTGAGYGGVPFYLDGSMKATFENLEAYENVGGLFTPNSEPSGTPSTDPYIDSANGCSSDYALDYYSLQIEKGAIYAYKYKDKTYLFKHFANDSVTPSVMLAGNGVELTLKNCNIHDNYSEDSAIHFGSHNEDNPLFSASKEKYLSPDFLARNKIMNATVSGGTFKHNYGYYSGGAIWVTTASRLTVQDNAKFEQNFSILGGAIGTYDGFITSPSVTDIRETRGDMNDFLEYQKHYPAQVIIDGATFEGNGASAGGGALYIASAKNEVRKATFTNNTSSQGGAIYVAGVPYELDINKAYVSGNECGKEYYTVGRDGSKPDPNYSDFYQFTGQGGGIWSCDTGHVIAQEHALYLGGNTNPKDEWGPDYYAEPKGTPEKPYYTTYIVKSAEETEEDRQADIAAKKKNHDKFIKSTFDSYINFPGATEETKWSLATTMPTFGAKDVAENWLVWKDGKFVPATDADIKNNDKNEFVILKAQTTDPDSALSSAASSKDYNVIITGNHAGRGGGIGTNGGVRFVTGKPPVPTVPVVIEKKWSPEYADKANDDNLTVTLKLGLRTDGKKSTAEGQTAFVADKTAATYLSDVVLSKANNWQITYDGLSEADAQRLVVVSEKVSDPSFTSTKTISKMTDVAAVSGGAPRHFYVSVTNGAPNTSVTVSKTWTDANGKQLSAEAVKDLSVKVQLFADGKASGEPVVLDATNSWKHVFENLPQQANGKDVAYTVKEVAAPEGFETTVTHQTDGSWLITNKQKPNKPHEPVTSVKVTKAWADADGKQLSADAVKDLSVKVQLFAGDKAVGQPVALDATNGWTYTFENLPAKAGEQDIVYTVKEVAAPEGFESSVAQQTDGSWLITNKLKPKKPHEPSNPPSTPDNPPKTPDKPHYPYVRRIPKTNDVSNVPFGIACGVALLMIAGGAVLQRKHD